MRHIDLSASGAPRRLHDVFRCASAPGCDASRRLFLGACFLPTVAFLRPARADAAAWNALREPGAIVLFRHATAPGVGDPVDMRLGDCATQRNLDDRGRAQARRLGERFEAEGIQVARVLSSRWCRARDTARLAFGDRVAGGVRDEPAFDSFFARRSGRDPQTDQARMLLRQWKGPGVLVVVTHQVNIQALTNESTTSGEGLVVRVGEGSAPLQVLGRVLP
ncbi:histidine phosphatase family protein [Ramlibacter sp. AN1015]|uniref:histidine phosphatase family protein n=1 Tax=Ramlibacter sp. AN1015 TaxID=3133428 RepID=UPI0030BDA147